MLAERIDRLEKKVDDGFARVDEQFAHVDRRFDEVYEAMGNGFAEHRRLLVDHIDGRIGQLRSEFKHDLEREIGTARAEMRDGFAAVNARFDAQATETGTRFDRLEAKLDAFVDAQSAVNRTILELVRPRG
jgi:chromosome segregation ATPase